MTEVLHTGSRKRSFDSAPMVGHDVERAERRSGVMAMEKREAKRTLKKQVRKLVKKVGRQRATSLVADLVRSEAAAVPTATEARADEAPAAAPKPARKKAKSGDAARKKPAARAAGA
jgi:hypothetical protein